MSKFGQNLFIPTRDRVRTSHFPTNLSPPVTLKKGSRSSKSNQFFYMSQHCRCASLVKIYSFLQEIGCGQAIFQQSKPSCYLENPKSNQFFYMSQHCRCASLVKIYSFLQEIGIEIDNRNRDRDRQAIFQQSKPSCDLENGVKVTKI